MNLEPERKLWSFASVIATAAQTAFMIQKKKWLQKWQITAKNPLCCCYFSVNATQVSCSWIVRWCNGVRMPQFRLIISSSLLFASLFPLPLITFLPHLPICTALLIRFFFFLRTKCFLCVFSAGTTGRSEMSVTLFDT